MRQKHILPSRRSKIPLALGGEADKKKFISAGCFIRHTA
jgi:hypothetical protein